VSGKILIVDDDEHILRAMATSLTRAGFDVVTANDGEPAMAMRESFAVVVADFNMRGEATGADVVRHFKKTDPSVTCFVLSGEDDPDLRETCIAAGAADMLVKPVAPVELRRRLAEAMKGSVAA
jgi:DNA-binding response OmpR family regulator